MAGTGVDRGRGVSTVLGVVFLVAVVVLALGVLGVLGAGSFSQTKENVDTEVVERELVRLSGAAGDVAMGGGDVRTVDLKLNTLGSKGTTHVQADRGRMTVVVGNDTVTNTTVFDGATGGVYYENQGISLAYQGGGVWRRAEGSATMVERPPFTARNFSATGDASATLSLPIVVVEGQATLSGGATVVSRGQTNRYPELVVPAGEVVRIRIESEYAPAWARYFRDRMGFPGSQVSVAPGDDAMTATYGKGVEVYLHATVYRIGIDGK